jgi:hypothetical protein
MEPVGGYDIEGMSGVIGDALLRRFQDLDLGSGEPLSESPHFRGRKIKVAQEQEGPPAPRAAFEEPVLKGPTWIQKFVKHFERKDLSKIQDFPKRVASDVPRIALAGQEFSERSEEKDIPLPPQPTRVAETEPPIDKVLSDPFVLVHVFRFLNPKDAGNAALVNRTFRKARQMRQSPYVMWLIEQFKDSNISFSLDDDGDLLPLTTARGKRLLVERLTMLSKSVGIDQKVKMPFQELVQNATELSKFLQT